LAQERWAIRDFVEADPLLRRFFTVFLFEDLPAGDRRADEVYLAEVDRCAVYVGLFGNDYGFEDAAGISPTEHEFDRATARGKPRLIFVKGSDDRARHPKMGALVGKAGG
jgi:ATP-dependent DNA helicase RecG